MDGGWKEWSRYSSRQYTKAKTFLFNWVTLIVPGVLLPQLGCMQKGIIKAISHGFVSLSFSFAVNLLSLKLKDSELEKASIVDSEVRLGHMTIRQCRGRYHLNMFSSLFLFGFIFTKPRFLGYLRPVEPNHTLPPLAATTI